MNGWPSYGSGEGSRKALGQDRRPAFKGGRMKTSSGLSARKLLRRWLSLHLGEKISKFPFDRGGVKEGKLTLTPSSSYPTHSTAATSGKEL